jgi:hypothetical protein
LVALLRGCGQKRGHQHDEGSRQPEQLGGKYRGHGVTGASSGERSYRLSVASAPSGSRFWPCRKQKLKRRRRLKPRLATGSGPARADLAVAVTCSTRRPNAAADRCRFPSTIASAANRPRPRRSANSSPMPSAAPASPFCARTPSRAGRSSKRAFPLRHDAAADCAASRSRKRSRVFPSHLVPAQSKR